VVFVPQGSGGVAVTDEKGRQVVTVPQGDGSIAVVGDPQLIETLSKMKRANESVEEYMSRMATGKT